MIRRFMSLLVIAWLFGFLWFGIALPQPAGSGQTDAIVVPTGSGGRIARGLEMLRAQEAPVLLVTGVHSDVRPGEFAAEYKVDEPLMDCCITLGFDALDTRGNARETADWVTAQEVHSIRLVTADWHMRRAALEIEMKLPDDVEVLRDAVPSEPSLWTLFLEYNKYLATRLAQIWPA